MLPSCPLKIFYQAILCCCCYATKSLQSCLTLCVPIDGLLPDSSVPGILQARTLEWVAISFSNAWKWKNQVKSLSRVRLLATSWTAAYQAPPSMGFFQAWVLEWGAIAFSEFYAKKCIKIYIFLLLLACTSFLFEFAWKSSSISWVLLNSQLPLWLTLNIEEKLKTDKYQQHASSVRGCFTQIERLDHYYSWNV